MYNTIFEELKARLMKIFDENLQDGLHYHNSHHTLDVVKRAENIAHLEGIEDQETIFLLKVAALFHDAGFLEVYADHEAKSCEIMRHEMQKYELPEEKIRIIEDIIMATKMPQTPQNHIQQIMCDADLDYLGRDDFFPISKKLKEEMLNFGLLKNEAEWEGKQLVFFDNHHYFTKSARAIRMAGKEATLKILKEQSENPNKV